MKIVKGKCKYCKKAFLYKSYPSCMTRVYCSRHCQIKAQRINPERDMEILRLRKEGFTLVQIAYPYRITPERVRQIILKTKKYIKNDSL